MKMHVAVAAALAAAVVPVAAQTAKVPRETVTALFADKKVAVEYGRPALGGRKMDELLGQLPADRIWRAGMDQATTLTTDTELTIGGKRVPPGKYTVYLHAPATGDYSLVLNSDPGIALKKIYAAAPPAVADAMWPRLDGYDNVKATEMLRVPLKKTAAAAPMDRFLIGLAPARDGVSAITMTWGDQSWTTEVRAASAAKAPTR